MFKTNHRFAATAICAMLAALAASPAAAATTQASAANVQILETIQFAVLLDMNLGKIAATGSSGWMTLDPDTNARSCDPTIICLGSFAPSELRLTGSDANVVVNFAPSFALNGPGQPITAEPLFPGGTGAVVHLTGGSTVVRFGARIFVNANQTPGIYSGDFSVNLEYN
jgi:Domain of unknown function (DUF4402)